MNYRQCEMNKIETYKVNWYALVACICSEKPKSVSSACRGLGVELKQEKTTKAVYNYSKFDLNVVKKLYKELGVVRQVAIKMNVCEATLRIFMKTNGIEIIKHRISDSFDIKEIMRLEKEGKSLKDISKTTGYEYFNLYKFMSAKKKEGALI